MVFLSPVELQFILRHAFCVVTRPPGMREFLYDRTSLSLVQRPITFTSSNMLAQLVDPHVVLPSVADSSAHHCHCNVFKRSKVYRSRLISVTILDEVAVTRSTEAHSKQATNKLDPLVAPSGTFLSTCITG